MGQRGRDPWNGGTLMGGQMRPLSAHRSRPDWMLFRTLHAKVRRVSLSKLEEKQHVLSNE